MTIEAQFALFKKIVLQPLFYMGNTPVTLAGVAMAVLVLGATLALSHILQRILTLRLAKFKYMPQGTAYAIRRIIHYALVVAGILLALQIMGLSLGSLAVMLGFLSVGVGFGLQNITSNFISGLILLFERPVGVGDLITVEEGTGPVVGRVQHIGLRSTLVQTLDNVSLIVPNSQFIENKVVNWSHGDLKVRLHVPVGVAYGSDLEKVTRLLLTVGKAHKEVLVDPPPDVRFLEFGNSSLNFELLVWTLRPDLRLVLRSQLNYAIDKIFRENNIVIPFPQRDVHVVKDLSP